MKIAANNPDDVQAIVTNLQNKATALNTYSAALKTCIKTLVWLGVGLSGVVALLVGFAVPALVKSRSTVEVPTVVLLFSGVTSLVVFCAGYNSIPEGVFEAHGEFLCYLYICFLFV